MDKARLKAIARQARTADRATLHDLFFEVYGADYGGNLNDDRARISIREAVDQLLNREPITEAEPTPVPAPPEARTMDAVQAGEVEQAGAPERVTRSAKRKKPLSLEPL